MEDLLNEHLKTTGAELMQVHNFANTGKLQNLFGKVRASPAKSEFIASARDAIYSTQMAWQRTTLIELLLQIMMMICL
jgi:hypothetical protein